MHIYIDTESEREREREKRDREKMRERERGERRERERMERHSSALISVLLIQSFYLAILLPSGRNSPRGCFLQNFRALITEQRAKETRRAPAKRLEIALLFLGQHQLALGHSTRQLPREGRRL